MTREALIKHWDVVQAFKDGKQIQSFTTDSQWMDLKYPTFEEDVKYRVKPEVKKRLPTIEEVEKWFLENKVFRWKETGALLRLQNVDCRECEKNQICDYNVWITIEEFCEDYTHYDGSELYITE